MILYYRIINALPISVILYLQLVDIVEGGMRSCYFGPVPQPKPGDDPLNVYRWMLQSVQNGCRNEEPSHVTPTPKYQVCPYAVPLGMESGAIPDDSITASSEWGSSGYEAIRARLNTQEFVSAGGWCKKTSDKTPWIQVDFESKVYITGLITQGRDLGEYPVYNWVITFTVEFSDNGIEWSAVMTAGGVPLESGNTDSETQVTVTFAKTLFARYLRILPTLWKDEGCMRFEKRYKITTTWTIPYIDCI
ncbi:retinoschisin-like [Asterias amurensis]|uniref:retinoschisin-like n=1 Tax=Asterias amurensis TaxID=7602 RepID=UPI003AB4E4D9